MYLGREHIRILLADRAIDAVGGDDQIGIRVILGAARRLVEVQGHAESARPLLQDVEQAGTPDAGETVAAGAGATAPIVDFDLFPVVQRSLDRRMGRLVGGGEGGQGLVGEHHAPAVGVVGGRLLEDTDAAGGIGLLQQNRKIQAGRAGAETDYMHGFRPGAENA